MYHSGSCLGHFNKTVVAIFLSFSFLFSLSVLPVYALDLAGKTDRTFQKWDKPNSPGCAVAIVKDGTIIYEKGYGMASLEFGIPNTPTTVFNWGSNSKQFTVFSILLLEEEGKLSLQDDIRTYIPEIPDFGKKIAIQHLIDHTSGMRDYLELMGFGGWNLLEDMITKEQGLHLVQWQKALNFEPGDQMMYCNTGFFLLAEIVARISGKTFAEFTKERIFTPLEMSHSHFEDNHRNIVADFSDPYYLAADGKFYQLPVNMSCVGESGLLSTVEDIAKWDQNFYTAKIGSTLILEKMHKKGILNNGQLSQMSAGLIVTDYKGRRLVYHGGDLGGYHGQIARFPDDRLTIITASNTAELDSNTLLTHSVSIADFYFANGTEIPDFMIHEPSLRGWGMGEPGFYTPDRESVLFWDELNRNRTEPPPFPVKTVEPLMTAEAAQEYVGLYYSDELELFYTISFDNQSSLQFQHPRNPAPYMFSVKNITRRNTFKAVESELLTGSFLRNSENQVVGFTIGNPRIIDLEFRKAEIVTKK